MAKRQFKAKNILITGAAGNLGTALALAFGKEGAHIIGLDLTEEPLKRWQDRLLAEKTKATYRFADITNKNKLEQTIKELQQEYGPIDVLVNNAGITHIERLINIEEPERILRKLMEVNLFAAAKLTNLLLEDIIQQKGLIINISSVAGFAPLIGRTAYAASKHALHGYFESLRNELHEEGVQSLMVCPSFIAPNPEFIGDTKSNENSIYQNKKTLGRTISVEKLAAKILKSAQQNRPRLIAGQAGRISYYLRRFFPNLYEGLMRNKLNNEL